MNYSNIRIVNQPVNPALGWTTINQGSNSIQFPSGSPFYGPSIGNSQVGSMQSSGSSQSSGSQMMPTTPAPNFTPQKNQSQFSTFAIDAGSIRGCLYRWVYIWPSRSNQGFWLYLTYVGRRSIAGFRSSRWGFSYYGMDVNQIDSFQCY